MNNLLAHEDNTPTSKLHCAEKVQGLNVASCKDCADRDTKAKTQAGRYPWYKGAKAQAGRCP